MQVELEGKYPNSNPPRVLLEGEGRTLSITLDADEELVEATLTLVQALGGNPSFSAPTIATDKGAALAAITWISADWGSTRTLAKLAIGTITAANAMRLRLQIARGGSQWYAPPGPSSFVVPAGSLPFEATLPDTVADRVMLELIRNDGVFEPVTVSANPTFTFGTRARDITIEVQNKRQVFFLAGEPEGAVVVPDLLGALREQKVGLSGPTTIVLVIKAGAAGELGVQTSLIVDKILSSFVEPQPGPSAALSLSWAGEAEAVLFRRATKGSDRARVQGIELTLTHEPVREKLILQPNPALLGEAVGELLRSQVESAQRFTLAGPERLIGASIWARPLSALVKGSATLYADEAGVPASTPLAQASFELDDQEFFRTGPRWVELELAAPVDVPAGSLWLSVTCETGELGWIVGHPRPAVIGDLRQRRNGGAWLSRGEQDPDGWALLRVRAAEQGELPMPSAELIMRDRAGGGGPQIVPLSFDASGKASWIPANPTDADAAGQVVVRVRSSVPTTVSLSALKLRWRPVAPGLMDADEALEPIELIELGA